MLVLTRKIGEQIVVDETIIITISRVDGKRVSIGIDAPKDQKILRGELVSQETNPPAEDTE